MSEERKKDYSMVFAIVITIAAFLQIYGIIRYLRRMPQDGVGIVIYAVVSMLFVILALVNYVRSFKTKRINE